MQWTRVYVTLNIWPTTVKKSAGALMMIVKQSSRACQKTADDNPGEISSLLMRLLYNHTMHATNTRIVCDFFF